jgi:hypothetical protein
MTRIVIDVIFPFPGPAGKVVVPSEHILNEGVPLPGEPLCQKVHGGKNYPVICSHRTTWDKMEVKNVSS